MSLELLARPATLSAPQRCTTAGSECRAVAAPPAAAGDPAPPMPNPRLRLDPQLGMVVMEFRSGPGVPERSIPSAQELAAYRTAALTGAPRPGDPPRDPGEG